MNIYASAAARCLVNSFWKPHAFESVVRLVAPVVRLCGYDTAAATVENMEASTIRLACKLCNPPSEIRIMTWYRAVSLDFPV